jgi:hypothetical protein
MTMWKVDLSLGKRVGGVRCLLLIGLMLLTACGGGDGASTSADAAAAEIGKVIKSDQWQAELLQPPEQTKVVGEGNITYQSENGTYLIVFLKVTNLSGTQQVVPRDLFTVHDGQGQEFKATKSAIQVAYVLNKGMQPLLDAPLGANTARDSVVIFDLPADASGLTLNMAGATDTLALGF